MTAATTAPLRAIVFDMDGLLADTEPLSFRAWSTMIARDYGATITAEDERWSANTVGKSGPIVWELIRDHFKLPVELPRDLPLLGSRSREIYHQLLAQGVPPMPGAIALVHACRDAGLRIGVASSSGMEEIHTVLTGLGIIDCFASLTSGKEVPRSKPDPAIYLLACSRLGVEPREAVALEDSGPGVAAARAAGLRCLAIPSEVTSTHDLSPANVIRSSLVDVTPADLAALPW
ncbi:MAG TPA: HAD-IA family hydrolase [Thermomicrobiales bacterium]